MKYYVGKPVIYRFVEYDGTMESLKPIIEDEEIDCTFEITSRGAAMILENEGRPNEAFQAQCVLPGNIVAVSDGGGVFAYHRRFFEKRGGLVLDQLPEFLNEYK